MFDIFDFIFEGFFGFVVFGFLVFWIYSLSSRVRRLEQLVGSKEVTSQPVSEQGSKFADPFEQFDKINKGAAAMPASSPSIQLEPAGPSWSQSFFKWLSDDWLLKLGAFLLLIGFGWFVTYAFMNNWIGPLGRIALGIIFGSTVLLLGFWRIQKYVNQGGTFLVLGSTIILLTVFAGRTMYDFFDPMSALVIMFLSTAFVAFASVKYRSRNLAFAGLVLAGIAPLLTNAPTTDHVGLFSYLLVVVLGAIWVVALTGQRELTTAALILVFFYSMPHLFGMIRTTDLLLIFAFAFTTVFFISNIFGIIKSKDNKVGADLVTAVVNGIFLLSWIGVVVEQEWKSLVMAAWMIVFACASFMAYRITKKRSPFYAYAIVCVALLAAATAVELEGAWLIVAYAIEASLVPVVAYFVTKDFKPSLNLSWLMVIPVLLSVEIVVEGYSQYHFFEDFFVLLTMLLTLVGLGLFFWHETRSKDNQGLKVYNETLLIVGSVYFYALIWQTVEAVFGSDVSTMISLVVYTVIGLAFYLYGQNNSIKGLRVYGATVLGLVVARLLLVEIWDMDLTGRIITFFAVGALLISTAFLGRKEKLAPKI